MSPLIRFDPTMDHTPVYRYYNSLRRSSNSSMDSAGLNTSTASSASSSALTISVDVYSIDEEQLRCPICGHAFRQPVRIDCGHSFCKQCIDKWLRSCNCCSICRQPTLEPRRNLDLERIMEKRHPSSSSSTKSSFFRRATQPFRRVFSHTAATKTPTKDVRLLQRETLRASIRRPKHVDLERVLRQKRVQPERVDDEAQKRRDWDASMNASTIQPHGLLRRSIRKVRQLL